MGRIAAAIGLMAAALVGSFMLLRRIDPTFLDIFSSQQQFRSYIDGFGQYGPLAYICLQALQVIVAPIPGEFTGSVAGILFGTVLGSVYATCGLALGSAIAFSLGRAFGQPLVKWMVPEAQRGKFAAISSRKQLLLVFIIFVIPGLPKDSLTYLFSVGTVSYWQFFFVSQAARIPGTILLVAAGDALASRNWLVLGIMAIPFTAMAAVVYSRRSKILDWLRG